MQQIIVEETQLQMDPTREDGSVVAVGTGKLLTFPAQMVLTSIGYRSTPVDGLPFDVRRGLSLKKNSLSLFLLFSAYSLTQRFLFS